LLRREVSGPIKKVEKSARPGNGFGGSIDAQVFRLP